MLLIRFLSRSLSPRASFLMTVTTMFLLIECSMNRPWVSLSSGT